MRIRHLYLTVIITLTLVWGILSIAPLLRPYSESELPDLNASLATIESVAQRQRVLGYERTNFGNGWGRAPASHCTSREAAIARQVNPAPQECKTKNGVLYDPYAQEELVIEDPTTALEVDHIFPLSAAWDLGAYLWDTQTRIELANDPLNLVVTASAHNQAKSDALPSQWMPPHRGSHCWYATRFAAVAAKYDLSLPQLDIRKLKSACRLSFTQKYG